MESIIEEFFFDSCVTIEVLKENHKFEKYADKYQTFTIFNLAEIYSYLLKNWAYVNAVKTYFSLISSVKPISEKIIMEAVEFMINHNKKLTKKQKPISYADAIGYIYAKENNLKFLTCDSQFEKLPNVEFVKK